MCNSIFNHRLAPLNEKHLEDIKGVFPDQSTFLQETYEVLTKDLRPQVNLLVAFAVLKHQFDNGVRGIFGNFGKVLYAPLSIVAKTGEHEWTRFRPQPVDELHTSFLSFMMAKPNRYALNNLFGKYGLCFSQGHCCGILFGDIADVSNYEKSDLFKTRNVVRSYAESMAMPVVETDFAEIPIVTSDLGIAEKSFYDLYEETFSKIGVQSVSDYKDSGVSESWNLIISKTINPLGLKQDSIEARENVLAAK
jgi:hypothetical protein